MSQEEKDLATHVEICTIRYEGIQEKIDGLNTRLNKVERDISELKIQTQSGFADIKLLLERQNAGKQTQMIATFGTIITAVLAFVGYLLTK